jgi:aminocarboxymuconate-semialdehyde decarboxylase
MGIVIDAFSHILPKSFAEDLILAHPTHELKEAAGLGYIGEMENRVKVLDKFKIDKQVLTLARPNIWINMPEETALKMARRANDAFAQTNKQFPDRFIPVGTLPMLSEKFMSEFDRCIDDLGFVGIQVFSNMGGRYLDDPEFRWFFSKANTAKIPVWIHPQVHADWTEEYGINKVLGWLFDTSVALYRLVFSGVMNEYPELRIITHHMGGMIPHFSERIKWSYAGHHLFPHGKFISLPKDPLEYFQRFYGDTVLNGSVHAFECGYKFFGPKHIVFGTDYPWGPDKGERFIDGALHQIRSAQIPQAEKEQILGGNLQELLKRHP